MKKIFLIFLFSVLMVQVKAQNNIGAWYMYFGTNKFSEKWSWHTEAQHRNHDIVPNIEQLLLRTGLNYHYSKNAIFTGGYGYITGHQYDAGLFHPNSTEHRIFQQVIIKQNVSRVGVEHRYRAEQRWVNKSYISRYRYRVMLTFPLNNKEMTDKTFFLGLYDEIFINGRSDYFGLNRIYGALGYKFNSDLSLQLGILNQAKINSDKWYLQFALFYNLNFLKTE